MFNDFSSQLSLVLHAVFSALLVVGLIHALTRFTQFHWIWIWLAAAIFFGLHQWEERTALNKPVPTGAVLEFSELVQGTPEWDSFATILAIGDMKYRDLVRIQKAREERLEAEKAAARDKKDQERAAQRDADMKDLRSRAVEHLQATNGDLREGSKRDGE